MTRTQSITRIAAHGVGKEILQLKEFVELAPESPGVPYVRIIDPYLLLFLSY